MTDAFELTPRREVVVAILLAHGRYVLQLRDDHPAVSSPGLWGLFGGSVEPGENAAAAMRRELSEELGLDIPYVREVWRVRDYSPVGDFVFRSFVFVADITAEWPRHVLGEGQATDAFAADALPDLTSPLTRALIERYETVVRCR